MSSTLLSLGYVTKKSNCTTPRVFSLMRMMSHPKLLMRQSTRSTSEILPNDVYKLPSSTIQELFLMMVLKWSWVNVLFMDGVQSWVTAPKLQEDLLGTRGIGYCSLGLLMSSSVWCRQELILVTAPKFARGRRELLLSVWVCILIPNWCHEILVTAPKFARGLVRYKGWNR